MELLQLWRKEGEKGLDKVRSNFFFYFFFSLTGMKYGLYRFVRRHGAVSLYRETLNSVGILENTPLQFLRKLTGQFPNVFSCV